MSEEQNHPGILQVIEEKVEHALGLDAAPSSTEPVGNAAGGASTDTSAIEPAAQGATTGEGVGEAGNAAGAVVGQSSAGVASDAGDLPNAAVQSAAAPSESASASSAPSASQDVVTQVVSGSVDLRNAIIARLKNVKQLLAVHHFEQSVTQGIHDELDAIERLL